MDAGEHVKAIAEMLDAPVMVGRMGQGALDGRHRLSVTMPAGYRFWGEADVVLAVGTRLQAAQQNWGVDDGLKIIRIDIDGEEIDRQRKPEIGIIGDAIACLKVLAGKLGAHNKKRNGRAEAVADADLRLREEDGVGLLGGHREVPVGLANEMEANVPESTGDSTLAATTELSGCLGPMIARLSEDSRQAITLVEIEGLTQKQAAERLGLSIPGMKSRVQRGRQQLRKLLEDCCLIELDRRRGVGRQPARREDPERHCGATDRTDRDLVEAADRDREQVARDRWRRLERRAEWP